MKRLFVTLAIFAISLSSFANPTDKVSAAALTSFNNTFKNITDVEWTVGDNFYKANFSLNGQYVNAFYDVNGEMLALTKNISSTQLPLTLQTSLKEQSKNFWIADLFEVANNEGTTYYVTLENGDTKLVLKSESNDWTTFKKIQKS
jgi:hypothetical protein